MSGRLVGLVINTIISRDLCHYGGPGIVKLSALLLEPARWTPCSKALTFGNFTNGVYRYKGVNATDRLWLVGRQLQWRR